MTREKFQHCFARKRLLDNNLKIYHNGKRILTPINSNFRDTDKRWEYPEMISEIIKGVSFMPELREKTRIARSYEELIHKTGLMISSKSPTRMNFIGQKVEYYLAMQDDMKKDFKDIPRGHKIVIDFSNRKAKLEGRNAIPRWITFQKKPPAGLGYYARDTFYDYQPSSDELMGEMFNISTPQQDVKIQIPEIIVGTSLEDGRLITIPEENFNPIIFICGKRRQGKTFLHYRLLDNFYHKWRKKCIDLIDIAREATTHCLEWRQKIFIDKLSVIGEKTRALPIIYLTPSTNTLNNIPLKDEVGIKISLPYNEIIFDYKNIFRGDESLEFEKTFIYFQNMLFDKDGNKREDGLAKCKDISEMKHFINGYINENAKLWGIKNPEGVVSKIINTLQYLYNQKILDVSIKENTEWTVEEIESGNKQKYNPWIACLIADIVPSINISDLVSNPVYPPYIKFILDDLFRNQTQNPLFLKNKWELFIFLNEVSSAVYDITSKKFTVVSDILDKIIRESGPHGIGVVFGTQYLNQVSGFAKSQANYVFSFRQNEKNADELIKDYDALKDIKSDLKRLGTFQCIGFPSGSPFILYDENGNKESIMDEPIPMQIFPPLSAHKPPKEI